MAGYSQSTSDAKTVKRWLQRRFAAETLSQVYLSRFMGKSSSSIIQKLTDLNETGDTINYQLRMALRGQGKRGKAVLKGHLESLVIHNDSVSIDTLRHGVEIDGRITMQRSELDLIEENKEALMEWLANITEEELFAQLAGRVGTQFRYLDLSYTGHAGNTLTTPDSDHVIYGGDATSEASIDSTDKFSLELIDRFRRDVEELDVKMPPAIVNGKEYWVAVIHTRQLFDLRRNVGEGEFTKLMSALATAEGKNSPIFKGGEFLYNGVIVHAHDRVPLFTNDNDVECANGFFLGRQAAVWANGNGGDGDTAMLKVEEDEDFGDKPQVAVTTLWGCKKTRFNGQDFGVMGIKTAAAGRAA